MIRTDEALLIKKINYAESSVILSFFTKNYGIKKFIFKGAKKRKQVFILFGLYELTFVDRSDDSLSIISNMQFIGAKNYRIEDPKKSLVAFFCADFLNSAILESEADLYFFQEISSLSKYNFQTMKQNDRVPHQLIGKTILYLGYCPNINNQFKPYFDLKSGEFSDIEGNSSVKLNHHEFDLLRSCFDSNLFFEDDVKFPSSCLKRVFKILIDYSNIHIPRMDIKKSLEIIQDVIYD